jgi:hypothetical protein
MPHQEEDSAAGPSPASRPSPVSEDDAVELIELGEDEDAPAATCGKSAAPVAPANRAGACCQRTLRLRHAAGTSRASPSVTARDRLAAPTRRARRIPTRCGRPHRIRPAAAGPSFREQDQGLRRRRRRQPQPQVEAHPKSTGNGAIRVRPFHGKLSDQSEYLDDASRRLTPPGGRGQSDEQHRSQASREPRWYSTWYDQRGPR